MSRTKQKARRERGKTALAPNTRVQKEVASNEPEKKQVVAGQRGRKRKLNESDDIDPNPSSKRTALDIKPGQPSSLDTVADPALLADHFAKCIQKWFAKYSPIELEDRYLPAKAFLDTTSYKRARVAANLPDFLERYSAGGKEGLCTCDKVASPHTIVITISGMRIADLMRELRVFKSKDSKVGKFMPKHMKLEMNVEFLQSNKVGIAIGTPERLNQLLEAGALKTGGLQRIVVDGSYQDEKRSTIFTNGQVFQPMVALLNDDSIRPRYGAAQNKIDILAF
ncbi:uncharacterized protein Z520_03757 [Fonsecaea multimorphosa CBS 102226]|uniref:Protein CMS1 n=1 Tax=Fonsecaea multimorphosa CBS 102226 TaxID=1442371 RepID=A0A0D2ISY1_9EURO|nr:uncharacterized protein Z520_03757 [Fonsecaea multimorphosa CBS 102226]KIY00072.1 hypothetical protein Z520_03757 [Fonsecaea multimorphosa CBS 102226]OAL27271.1 hypothetical protein AYO22_03546 [Fonsecaea multimorphosa]